MLSLETLTRSPSPPPATRQALSAQLRAHWDYLIDWLSRHSADIAIAVVAGLAIYLLLRTARRFIRGAAQRQADQTGFVATLLRVLARTGHFFLVMLSAQLVVGVADPPQLLAGIVRLLFTVAVAFQVALWVREAAMSLIRYRASHRSSETLGNALALIHVLVSVAVFSIALIVVLDNLGVNVTGLVAGLGIGGIAIGLAAKGVFEELFAALAIIFDRPFRNGDTISYDSTTATVERIGLKSTRLRALTGEEVIVSNSNLLSKEVKNFAIVPRRRLSLDFGVAYETPPEKLRAIPDMVRAIVEGAGHTLVQCVMTGFGASSLDFALSIDVFSPDGGVAQTARHEIAMTMIERFAQEEIAFAYPAQITFTADARGRLIDPYPRDATAS